MTFHVALASYSFHGLVGKGQLNLLGYLELLSSRYQVHWADIWTGLLPPESLDDAYLKTVRGWLDERQIGLANLCVDGPYVYHPDPDVRKQHERLMLRYLDAARMLGARSVRIDFGGDNQAMPDEAFEAIVAQYRVYCRICEDCGIKIGPENHWGWDRDPDNLRRVRDAVDSPAYGHLYHVRDWTKPDEASLLEVCLPCLMHTHFPADTVTWCKPLLKRLAASGYTGACSIEHHSGQHELPRVAWQLGCLQSQIAELEAESPETADDEGFIARSVRQGLPREVR